MLIECEINLNDNLFNIRSYTDNNESVIVINGEQLRQFQLVNKCFIKSSGLFSYFMNSESATVESALSHMNILIDSKINDFKILRNKVSSQLSDLDRELILSKSKSQSIPNT